MSYRYRNIRTLFSTPRISNHDPTLKPAIDGESRPDRPIKRAFHFGILVVLLSGAALLVPYEGYDTVFAPKSATALVTAAPPRPALPLDGILLSLALLLICRLISISKELGPITRVLQSSAEAARHLGKSLHHILHYLQRLGSITRSLVIIGHRRDTDDVARTLSTVTKIVSVFDLDENNETSAISALRDLGQQGEVNTLIFIDETDGVRDLLAMIEQLREIPFEIMLFSETSEILPDGREAFSIAGVPLSIICDAPMRAVARKLKSSFDRSGAFVLICLLSPLLVSISVSVWLDSDGPIIFSQRRNGWAGTYFTVYKFRTMKSGADNSYQTCAGDPRLTRIGSFLRRASLDELPQLFNVLSGEMSLVGPRPHVDALHRHQSKNKSIIANYIRRYRMKPGMTGWAQVNGFRGPTKSADELERRLELDLYYIENWSFLLDLKILFLTPMCVLRGKNAL